MQKQNPQRGGVGGQPQLPQLLRALEDRGEAGRAREAFDSLKPVLSLIGGGEKLKLLDVLLHGENPRMLLEDDVLKRLGGVGDFFAGSGVPANASNLLLYLGEGDDVEGMLTSASSVHRGLSKRFQTGLEEGLLAYDPSLRDSKHFKETMDEVRLRSHKLSEVPVDVVSDTEWSWRGFESAANAFFQGGRIFLNKRLLRGSSDVVASSLLHEYTHVVSYTHPSLNSRRVFVEGLSELLARMTSKALGIEKVGERFTYPLEAFILYALTKPVDDMEPPSNAGEMVSAFFKADTGFIDNLKVRLGKHSKYSFKMVDGQYQRTVEEVDLVDDVFPSGSSEKVLKEGRRSLTAFLGWHSRTYGPDRIDRVHGEAVRELGIKIHPI